MIPGYTLHTNISEDKDIRGVVIYVRSNLKSDTVVIPDSAFKDQVSVSISLKNSSILVQCIYRSGSKDKAAAMDGELHKLITSTSNLEEYTQKIIVGDFNHNQVLWTPEPVIPDNLPPNSSEAVFVDCIHDTLMSQHVSEPTRYRSDKDTGELINQPTIDDLIFSTHETDIDDLTYEPSFGKSDHIKLCCTLNCLGEIPAITVNPKKIYKYDKAKYENIRQDLDINWEELFKNRNVQDCMDLFEQKYADTVKKHVPIVEPGSQRYRPPWMTKGTLKKCKRKHSLWIRYLSTKQSTDYVNYTKIRNIVTHSIMKDRKEYEKTIARQCRTNPKAVRNYMKRSQKMRANIPNLKQKNGQLTKCNEEIAETLATQYHDVFTVENTEVLPSIPLKTLITNPLKTYVVSKEKVTKLLKELIPTKAPGIDKIHPKVLKETADIIANPLTHIFNLSIKEGQLPSQWLDAIVTPIYKKGPRSDPANYRPVSLTCILCKILEKIIVEQILQHLKDNGLMCEEQHGFVPGKSVTTNLLETLNKWSELLMHGHHVDVVYLDYSKAFDTVPHRRLLLQIRSFGIEGLALQWIEAFLSNRRQKVVANEAESGWSDVISGIPQGSVLGPVLFTLFVNDIPPLLKCFTAMYADDTKLHSPVDSDEDYEQLQADIWRIQDWAKEMQMKFHPDKCKIMYLGKKNPHRDYCLFNDDFSIHMLEETELEKDLGVYIDKNLSFTQHCQQKINTAVKMVNYIKHTFKYIDKEIFTFLYKSLVRPHLEFASCIWSPAQKFNINAIEKVQRRATRLVPEIRELRYEDRLRALNLETLSYRRMRADLLEVYRILSKQHQLDMDCHCPHCPGKLLLMSTPVQTTRNNSKKLYVQTATGIRHHFFSSRVTTWWNQLSEATVNSVNINQFKNHLKKDLGHLAFDCIT